MSTSPSVNPLGLLKLARPNLRLNIQSTKSLLPSSRFETSLPCHAPCQTLPLPPFFRIFALTLSLPQFPFLRLVLAVHLLSIVIQSVVFDIDAFPDGQSPPSPLLVPPAQCSFVPSSLIRMRRSLSPGSPPNFLSVAFSSVGFLPEDPPLLRFNHPIFYPVPLPPCPPQTTSTRGMLSF